MRGEEYPLSQQTGSSPAVQPAYIPVICPVCRTRVYTTIELVGQKLVCPDCGTPTVVPPPEPPAKPVAAPVAGEGYPLCEEASSVPHDDGAAEEVAIRLTCVRCGTMMYAAEDQIGQEIVCPDCDLPTIVRRPAEGPAKKPPRAASEIGEYAMADDEVDRPAGGPEAAKPTYVAALCPVCHTRLHATLDQVGDKLICPDCGTATVIPPPPPPPRSADVTAEIGAGYGLTGGEIAPRQARRNAARHLRRPASGLRRCGRSGSWNRPSGRPCPRGRFWAGRSPARSARAPAFELCVGGLVLLCAKMAEESIRLSIIATEATWIGSLSMGTSAFALTVMWFALASACGLAVAAATRPAAATSIQNWPDLAFVDWIIEPLYVFNSACVGLLPSIGLAWWTARSLQPT